MHQQKIREKKSLHTMQEFGSHPGNLGTQKPVAFWHGMRDIYGAIREYGRGYVVVVLRNRIRLGREVDEVGQHISLMRKAGLKTVGVHSRDLERPTGYQQWKVAKDPSTPWVRYEWVVVTLA